MLQQQHQHQPLTVLHNQPEQTQRSPWHPPRLERLHVSLDTALGGAVAVGDATQAFTTSG